MDVGESLWHIIFSVPSWRESDVWVPRTLKTQRRTMGCTDSVQRLYASHSDLREDKARTRLNLRMRDHGSPLHISGWSMHACSPSLWGPHSYWICRHSQPCSESWMDDSPAPFCFPLPLFLLIKATHFHLCYRQVFAVSQLIKSLFPHTADDNSPLQCHRFDSLSWPL